MNNVNNNGTPSGKNNTPLLIIGAVLLIALLGGWWFYSTNTAPNPKPNLSNNNTANNSNKKVDESEAIKKAIENAPAGANPPNMLGSPTATVTVEEFADYQCPTCATVHPMMQEIAKIYGNRIKFIYRSFPLSTIHPHAYDAAVAAEAAGLQGKFWEMQNQLFPNQKEWANAPDARKLFEGYAQKIGLDLDKYQNDVLGMGAQSRVKADVDRGRAIGISGTPTIYINDTPLDYQHFDIESIKKMIDGELQKPSGNQQSGQPANQATTVNQSNASVNAVNNTGNAKK